MFIWRIGILLWLLLLEKLGKSFVSFEFFCLFCCCEGARCIFGFVYNVVIEVFKLVFRNCKRLCVCLVFKTFGIEFFFFLCHVFF